MVNQQSSIWQSLAKALGIHRTLADGARELRIRKHVLDLQSHMDDMRRSAAWSLAKITPPAVEALDFLARVAEKDPSEIVRHSAKWSMDVIRGKKRLQSAAYDAPRLHSR